MLRECPLKPFARRRWIDQGVEEYRPVPVRQDERLVLRNRPPGGVRECRHAEIRQLAPFELRRPFDQSLGRLIYPKPKPRFRCRRSGFAVVAMVTSGLTCTSV
jgi:hypothetical protein